MATDATGSPTPLGIPKFNTSADAPSGLGTNAMADAIDALIAARVKVTGAVVEGDVPVWDTASSTWKPSAAKAYSGKELNYASISTPATSTAVSAASATTIIAPGAITFDGSPVVLEVFSPLLTHTVGGTTMALELYDGATDLVSLGNMTAPVANGGGPFHTRYRFSPTAGSHTYSLRLWSGGAGTATFQAGPGGAGVLAPAFMRFVRA